MSISGIAPTTVERSIDGDARQFNPVPPDRCDAVVAYGEVRRIRTRVRRRLGTNPPLDRAIGRNAIRNRPGRGCNYRSQVYRSEIWHRADPPRHGTVAEDGSH